MKKRKIGVLVCAVSMAMLTALSGCGSSGASYDSAAKGAYYSSDSAMEAPAYGVYEEAAEAMADNRSPSGAGEVVDNTNRKLITTVNLSAETEDLDKTVSSVTGKVKELGGYIESSNVYNGSNYGYSSRSASITARIPASRLDEFIESVEGANNITRKSVNVDDVTLTYVDIESKKNSLKTEEKRLLEIMESAETVEDIITIEDKLANVRYELESIESQLRSYDNQVDYSTVYLDVEEVKTFTPVEKEGAFARMGKGFMQSLSDVGEGFVEFCVWIVSHIPQLIVFILVILVIVLIVKAIITGSKKKKAKKIAMYQAQYAANMQNVNQTAGAAPDNVSNQATNAAPNTTVNVNPAPAAPEDKGNNGNKQ